MARKSSKQLRREEKQRRKVEKSDDRVHVPDAPALHRLALAVVLVVLTGIAYSNSFDGKFVYDDTKWVQQMSVDRIKHPIKSIMRARRPVVDATLSMNYSAATMQRAPRAMTVPQIPSPWGYHLVNLLIHICAGLTLFGLVRRTIRVGPFGDSVKSAAHWIAFSIAMLWLLHPLQTQSVTYIIQRAESLMGLFYLLTLYCLIRHATERDGSLKILWLIGTLVAASLGMGSKAVMVTIPIVALIFDRVFLAASWSDVITKRWPAHACITASLLVLVMCGVVQGVLLPPTAEKAQRATVGFGLTNSRHEYHVSSSEYLLTEAKVIPRYLKLSVLPTDQALDYKWEKVDPNRLSAGELFMESLLPGFLVLALLAATIIGLIRKPWLGFVGVWFFVILAPTSTFIPIRDPIYEHRMYLSLAAIVLLFVVGLWTLLSRLKSNSGGSPGPICAGICILPAIALMTLTFQRNTLYQDPLRLWEDNVRVVPDNWRARNNLAKQYLDDAEENPGYVHKAIEHLELAVESNPDFVNGWYNLGNAYSRTKEYDKAINAYKNALAKNPVYTVAHIMLGNAYTDKANMMLTQLPTDIQERKARRQESIAALELAAEAFMTAAPTANRNTTNDRTLRARAFYNLGNTYARLAQLTQASKGDAGLLDAARDAYEDALATSARHPSARVGIGLTYFRQAKYDEAIAAFTDALEFDPPQNEKMIALANLGNSYFSLKRYPEAAREFAKLTVQFPTFEPGWSSLVKSLELQGKDVEALESAIEGARTLNATRRIFMDVQRLAAKLGRTADEQWAAKELERFRSKR